jgi:hypothetical protein
MLLKDISIHSLPNSIYQSQKFNLETVCVTDIYLRNLLPYRNDHIKKLNIVLIGLDYEDQVLFLHTGLPLGKFNNLLSFGETFLEFDFENYQKKDVHERKLAILDKIQEGFMVFARETNSDDQPFKDAYQKCLDQGLKDEYVYKEATSKNRMYKVTVFIKVDLAEMEVMGVFYNKTKNEISRRTFFKRRPEALYGHYLGKVVWSGEDEVTLYSKSEVTLSGQRVSDSWTIKLND